MKPQINGAALRPSVMPPVLFRTEQEIDVCSDLGDSLFAQGKGDIREIRKNEICNFADCLGKPR